MPLTTDVVLRIGYALGIGILVGLERSIGPPGSPLARPDQTEDGASAVGATDEYVDQQFLGLRTCSIFSLTGFAAAMIGSAYPAAAAVVLGGLIALVVALYLRSPGSDPGITTEAAAIACCGLGALCYSHPHEAGVLAILITIMLAMKRFAATAVTRLRRVELTDTLKFLVVIFVLLPLLPNRALDPWGTFNPYKLVLLVILISGISFVGYFLTRFLGARRGLGLTGLLGGLTSSTAVTAAMASQARANPILAEPCTFATVIANATMFGRVLVVVALLDSQLVLRLAPSVGAMLTVALAAVVALWLRNSRRTEGSDEASGEMPLSNPFSLGPAIKFAAFFVVILLVAKVAKLYLGNQGLYLASLVSGLADVDAITLSVTEQTRQGALEPGTGALAITIAVIANSVVKSWISVYSGGWRYGRVVGAILLGATCAGLGVLLAL